MSKRTRENREQRTRKRMTWTTEKLERLSMQYPTAQLKKLADELECTVHQLVWKANKIGLRRKVKVYTTKATVPKDKSVYFGNRKRIGKNTYPVTHATRTLICSCALSGYTSEQTAMLTERSIEQVEEILQECKENGWFAMIKHYRETLEMTIAKDKML